MDKKAIHSDNLTNAIVRYFRETMTNGDSSIYERMLDSDNVLKQACSLYQTRAYDQTIELLQRNYEDSSQQALWSLALAITYFELSEIDLACDEIHRAITINSKNATLYYYGALIHVTTGQTVSANELIRKSLLLSNSLRAYALRIYILAYSNINWFRIFHVVFSFLPFLLVRYPWIASAMVAIYGVIRVIIIWPIWDIRIPLSKRLLFSLALWGAIVILWITLNQ